MTGSWVIDAFIIGLIILIAYPTGVYLSKEVIKKNKENGSD